jgi:hypothetical protein
VSGCLLDHNDHKPAHDFRLNFCAGNGKHSVHLNIAFPLSTLKHFDRWISWTCTCQLSSEPTAKLEKRVELHSSLLYNSRFKPEAYLIYAVFMLFHSTFMVFAVQERQFSLPWMWSYRFLYAQNVYSCRISTMDETGNGVAHKGRLSLLSPRCFTMLPSEGKRTIARARKKQSVRPCDEFVIGTQVEKLDWCFGRGR